MCERKGYFDCIRSLFTHQLYERSIKISVRMKENNGFQISLKSFINSSNECIFLKKKKLRMISKQTAH